MELRDLKVPTVAIVVFKAEKETIKEMERFVSVTQQPMMIPRLVHYQVTVDAERISPTGDFIRFGISGDGKGQGDEITGWQPIDSLEIVEVLAATDETNTLQAVKAA